MRIGIFTECYKPVLNGVVNSIDGFRRGLIELGHEVYIFCPNYKENINEKNIIRCNSIPFPGKSKYYYILPFNSRVTSIARTMDIIHTQHPFTMASHAYKIAKNFNKPFLFTNHTQYEEYAHYAPFGKSLVRWYMKTYIKNFAQKCNMIIAPAQGIKDKLLSYNIKTPIKIVPNGIDLNRFKSQDKSFIRNKYKLNIWPTLVFVGRIAEEKNLTFLINAFRKVIEKYPNCYLLLVGGGPEEKHFHNLITIPHLVGEVSRLKDRVIITGFVPYKEIPNYLASSDIFVSASKTEVHPLTVLEAMASGLPSVVFDTVGTGEIIENGIDGIKTKTDNLNEYSDAICELLRDNHKRQELGSTALEKSKKYSYLETSKIMEKIYQEVIEKNKDLSTSLDNTRDESLETKEQA